MWQHTHPWAPHPAQPCSRTTSPPLSWMTLLSRTWLRSTTRMLDRCNSLTVPLLLIPHCSVNTLSIVPYLWLHSSAMHASSKCKEWSHATPLVCNQFADQCLRSGLHTSAFLFFSPEWGWVTVAQILRIWVVVMLQICIKWGLQHGTSVIPKATSEDHVVGNADVFDWELSSEDFEVCLLAC